MNIQAKPLISVDEYLAMEKESEARHEYLNGEIFAMGGASPNHVLIVTNVVAELRTQLKKRPCAVYSTDLRVLVSPTGLYAYPDVVSHMHNIRKLMIFSIWSIGYCILYIAWEFQKTIPGDSGELLAQLVFALSSFYIFAFYPIDLLIDKIYYKLKKKTT